MDTQSLSHHCTYMLVVQSTHELSHHPVTVHMYTHDNNLIGEFVTALYIYVLEIRKQFSYTCMSTCSFESKLLSVLKSSDISFPRSATLEYA